MRNDDDDEDDNDDDDDGLTAAVRADPALDLFHRNLGNCKLWVTYLPPALFSF